MRKMLAPHVRAIGRPAGPAQDDAVDQARAGGTPAALKSDLIQLVGKDQVLHRISDLVRYASDASPYEPPYVSRTGNSAVIYAAACISSSASMTSCGVLYPSAE